MKKLFTSTKNLLATGLLIMFFGSFAHSQVVVVATAGNPGPVNYLTLNDAFIAINAGTHQGVIGVAITASTTEAGPCVLNASGAGPAVYTSVGIGPTVDGVTISGPTTTGRGLIELNGADNVTIDGDNPNTGGINRNLTITNTAANTVTLTSVIRVALSTLVTSGDNNTFRNLILNGSATGRNIAAATSTTGTEYNTIGIFVGTGASTVANTTAPSALTSSTTTVAAPITAQNLLVENNAIINAGRGISCNGSATSVFTNLIIRNNVIGNPVIGAVDGVYSNGITIGGTTGALIQGNTIYVEGFIGSSTQNMAGINVGALSVNTTAVTIENNVIGRVYNMNGGTWPAYGINLAGGSNHIVRNNLVGTCLGSQTAGTGGFSTTFGSFGIRVASGTGHRVIHNTVHFTGTVPGTTSTLLEACLAIVGTGQTGVEVRNNIFSNQLNGGNPTLYNTVNTCVYLPAGGTSAMNLLWNNNAYYQGGAAMNSIAQVSTTGNAANFYTAANFNPAITTPATNFRAYSSTLSAAGTNDNASYASTNATPVISATNLHLDLASAELPNVEQKGDPAVGLAIDIDGDVRPSASTVNPDMGGDEVVVANCSAASGGTISPATQTVCAGSTTLMTSTGATTGTGITYQWMTSTVSGGPYSNVVGGSGATTTAYTTPALTAGVYYYVLQTTCSFGPLTGLSNELTVTVNAAPTVNVSPTSATYCSGAAGVSLTASGTAIGYSWGPAAGLSATTGANVTASPAVNTTYTVTGIDGNGCTAAATTTITVVQTPSISSLTSTPSAVCTGGNAQLSATAGTTSTYSVTSIPFAAVPTPGVGVTTLANTGVAVAPLSAGNLDDGGWMNQVIPFPFSYFGITYNSFAVSTNGFIWLGTGAPNTYTGYSIAFPNVGAARPSIGAMYSDLDFRTVGTVEYFTTGTAPYRAVVVNWTGGNFYNAVGSMTTQLIIYETTNVIEVHTTSSTGNNAAVEGIQNAAGTAAVTVAGRNNVTWPVSVPDAYRWSPAGGTITYTWSPGTFLSSTTISNPMANAATATTTYTVVADNAGCSTSGTITLTVNPLPIVTLSGNNTICSNDSTLLTGSSGGTSQWYLNGVAIPGATSNTYYASQAGVYNMIKTNANGCSDSSATGITVVVNAVPTVTASVTSSTVCAGDMVTATGGGATTYVWSGGISDNVAFAAMATTTYTVTGTDGNGCSDTASVTVTVNPLPTVTATLTPSTVCTGDMVTPTGGGATSYAWSGGVTDGVAFAAMISDTYTVTGTDANGCSSTATAALTVNTLPSVSATSTDTIACMNDMVVFMGMGATSYTWNNGVIDNVPYMVTVSAAFIVTGTDANGCMASDTLMIIVNTLPTVTASATDSTVCVGDQVTFMGGGASTYTWDNGVTDMVPYTVTASGTFIVTGTDANGCSDTASLAINANALPNVTVSLPLDTACLLLGPVTLSGESPAGGTWSGTGVTGNSFNPGVAGNGMHAITYTYMDSVTGCSASAVDSILVDICNGIDNNETGNAVVYPNPSNGEFTLIPSGSGLVDVYIYNATGQLVVAQKATCGVQNNVRIDASGMYSVVVVTADGHRTTQRVVVNR
jgi:hypothetical protein